MRVIAVLLALVFSFLSSPLQAEAASLETQVLQIIRDHPEAILESVQSYEVKQRQARQQEQQVALQQIPPETLVGASPVQGAANKTLLIEFSDFECPFCADAAQDVRQFVEQHPKQVTFVYKHFPLTRIHDQAQSAAQAAWAAQQQGQFWAYHDALFAKQDQLGESRYVEIAQQLRLDVKQFNRDRNSPEAVAVIEADLALGEQVGIGGTPFFVLGDQVLDLPLDPIAMEKLL
ncbi:MAG: DsbA family protein [Thermosynechococcaceae cyanobacterium]